jgi:outer membrane protein
MKYLVKSFVVTFLLIFSTQSLAEQKIVLMDLKFILNNSKAGKGAQDFLKKSFQNNAKKFNSMEKKLKEQEKDLLGKKTILSKEEYKKKSDSLRKSVREYQSERKKSLDKITTQRAESRKILMSKIMPIVDTYIKENKISIVMDKKTMIGGLTEFDITNQIIDKLNKEFPSLNLK